MIPPEFLNENKRLKYEYIFSQEVLGELLPWIDWDGRTSLPKYLRKLFPYSVITDQIRVELCNEPLKMEEIEAWIGEHCHHPWQLWFDTRAEDKRLIEFMFENLTDATIFKLAYA